MIEKNTIQKMSKYKTHVTKLIIMFNFYLASLATNHSHSSYGDNTYTQVITLSYDDYLIGDLDCDGVINMVDIIVEINIILGITIPNDYQLIVGDLNSDSNINILDIVLIVDIILGID